MGLNSEVVAIGPFHPKLIPSLEHPSQRYANVVDGTVVISKIIEGVGSTTSREIAAACGVDPWTFGEHHLDPQRVDASALQKVADLMGLTNDVAIVFRELRDAGFEFYFVANG